MERLHSTPSSPHPNTLRAILRQLERLSARWGCPRLAELIRVKFTSGLQKSVARCNPKQGVVRLSLALLARENRRLLTEALSHEAAHVAAHRIYGPEVRPHGTEWQGLMRAAGFVPRLRLRLPAPRTRKTNPRPGRVLYEYLCPVCQTLHRSRRRDSRVRCRACVEAGLNGVMTITRQALASRARSQ